jgi:DNA-binding transcriptional ArsR family regulator
MVHDRERASVAAIFGPVTWPESRAEAPLLRPLRSRRDPCILNFMVQYTTGRLDVAFSALSDATRRGVLERLGRGDASITDLAQTFGMTLTGMKKHVGVLEQAGLVATQKVGRVRTCRLGPRRLDEESAWLDWYRRLWDERFDDLERVVQEQQQKEIDDGRNANE